MPGTALDLSRGQAAARRDGAAMLAADAAERLADRRMLGVERMPGDTAGAGNGGNSAAQGRHRVALAGRRQIGPDHLRRCRHGDETVPVAPGLVVREVGRISPQRRRGICGVLVGLRLGERYCCARGGRAAPRRANWACAPR